MRGKSREKMEDLGRRRGSNFGTQQKIANNQTDNRSERRVSNEGCNRVAVEIVYTGFATIMLGVGE